MDVRGFFDGFQAEIESKSLPRGGRCGSESLQELAERFQEATLDDLEAVEVSSGLEGHRNLEKRMEISQNPL